MYLVHKNVNLKKLVHQSYRYYNGNIIRELPKTFRPKGHYLTNAFLEHIQQIDQIYSNGVSRYGKDYLRTWDLEMNELHLIYHTAMALKYLHAMDKNTATVAYGLAVSDFRDKSTRTRSAFNSAAAMLGLSVMDFDTSKSQVEHGETVRESATMLNFLADTMGIRHDLYIGEGHKYQKEVADTFTDNFQTGLYRRRPTVINLQCDEDHPTQSMADLIHLATYFGGLEKLKGKKIAISWAHSPSYGKPLSVPQGLIGLLPRFGMDVVVAHPPGYDLFPMGWMECPTQYTKVDNMEEAFKDADVVYPKSWAPLHVLEERTQLYREGGATNEVMNKLEKECIDYNHKFTNWECTEDLMKLTKSSSYLSEALYMHCLPADITGVSCEQGEVQPSVFDRHRCMLYEEAFNKNFVIGSVMLTSMIEHSVAAALQSKFSGPSRIRSPKTFRMTEHDYGKRR